MPLSVIIPTLNERENLPQTIITARAAFPDAEIVVADGGSTDNTPEWVRANASPLLCLVSAARGRGPQMNAGAAKATGDVLLFLHADCVPPADAGALIAEALADSTVAGGCFGVRFAEKEPWSLPLTAWLITTHSRLTRTATGDQGIFVRRAVFDALGGYQLWQLFEDIEFVDRLKSKGQGFGMVPGKLTISARRWQTFGVFRTSLLMCVLWLGYRIGVPPDTLKTWFKDVRPRPKH